jgi:5-methylcytosine-specific restriction protein A
VQTLKSKISTLKPTGPKGVSATVRITGSRLQTIRRAKLLQNPACEVCAKSGIVTPAKVIDHIAPLWAGGSESANNRQSLCIRCHDAKSAIETKERNGG